MHRTGRRSGDVVRIVVLDPQDQDDVIDRQAVAVAVAMDERPGAPRQLELAEKCEQVAAREHDLDLARPEQKASHLNVARFADQASAGPEAPH